MVVPGRLENGSRARRGAASVGIALALFLVAAAFTAACLGDDRPGESGDINVRVTANRSGDDTDDSTPVLATFTPVPPDFTPEAVRTRSALQTAAALTATAQAQVTATAPPSVTVNPFPVTGTIPLNTIIPPNVGLITSGGAAPSALGSYNWYDLRFNRGAEVTAPYVLLPDGGAQWAGGTEARLEVASSPYAVMSAEIKFFVFDQNVAIPTDQSGKPGDRPAFYAQTAPVRQLSLQGPDIRFTPEVGPGRYIVDMRVNWSTPTGLNPLWTQYIFIVDVV